MTDALTRLSSALSDRYRIERELGQGGMATVYLAEDLKHDRKVALKVLKPELAAVIGAERFVVEIKTTAALSHPHILPLFDSGIARVDSQRSTVDGRQSTVDLLYYVMPFIDGETLRSKLDRETQLGIEESVRIATSVADALDYAHRHGVIHRDIKPENILLHDGRPMVADFGIALALSAAAGGRMTETGMSLGTPHYMSPEQATADKEITGRSDIYSLGSVLYEMLTGEPPHMGTSAQQIIMKIVTEEAAPVTRLRKSVPPNVAAAVAKAVERLPADRFATAREFAEALNDPGYTMAGMDAHAAGPARVWIRDRRSLALIGVAVAAVLALAASLMLRGKGADPGSVGPDEVVHATITLGDSVRVRAIANIRLAIAPSGRRVVFVGPNGADNALWVRELDQPAARPLPDTKGAFAPFFSPDGQSVGFVTADGGRLALKVIALTGGVARTLVADSVAQFGGADWADDGQIYFTDASRNLARVSSSGGAVTRIARPDSTQAIQELDFPDVLPGSRQALVMVWKGSITSNHIGLVDVASGAVTDLAPGSYVRYIGGGMIVIGTAEGNLLEAPLDARGGRLAGTPVLVRRNVQTDGSNGTVQFAVSSNGTLVYQPTSGDRAGLVWVDRDGQRTAVPSDPALVVSALALSPDASQIAVTRSELGDDQIWIEQLATGALSRLSFDVVSANRPVWTPDGKRVAYLASRDGRRTAWMRRADGSDAAEPASPPDVGLDEILFDPQGRFTLFRSEGSGPGSRHLMQIRNGVDSTPRSILPSRYDNYAIALSPDGQWLAYVSAEAGTPQVHVRPFPNVDSARYVVSVGGGVEPLWRRDGKELFFRSQRGDMYAVPVTTGRSFTHGVPHLLFDGTGLGMQEYYRGYDVHPDGRRFLMVTAGGSDATSLNVIFNWRAELKQLKLASP